jgi:hypothetical protein
MHSSSRKFQPGIKLRTLSTGLLFFVIPVLFLFAVKVLTQAKGPQWLPFTYENPYNYLFNSLLLLRGFAPCSIDHPGTTTQVFGAIVLRASSLAPANDLIGNVVRHPEEYIQILHWALLIFTVLILWLAPWLTAEVLTNRFTGILIQAPSLFFSTLLWYGAIYGPDLMLVPFSIAAICGCTLLMIPSQSRDRVVLLGIGDRLDGSAASRSIRIPLVATVTGLVCALGIATKLTFFPLILIALLCCRTRKNLLAFTIAFVFGLAVALLPIYAQLPRLATWIFNLGIHSGRYDAGAVGLPPSGVYFSSLLDLIQTEPLVVIVPIVATIVLLALWLISRKLSPINSIAWSTAGMLFAIQVISLFVIAKEVGPHYLIPLSLTTSLNLVLLLQVSSSSDASKLTRTAGWIALIGLLALGGKSFIEGTQDTYSDLNSQKHDLIRLYRHAEEVAKNDVRIDYYFSDSPVFPVCCGNSWAGGAFGTLLQTIYPNRLFFDVFKGQFQTFTEWIPPDVIRKKYDHLYFLGTPQWFPKVAGFEPDTFETIDHVGNYCLQKWTRK